MEFLTVVTLGEVSAVELAQSSVCFPFKSYQIALWGGGITSIPSAKLSLIEVQLFKKSQVGIKTIYKPPLLCESIRVPSFLPNLLLMWHL